jgi:hypothetical protein
LITIGFGIIVIVIGLIITGTDGGIWFIVRRRGRRATAEDGEQGLGCSERRSTSITAYTWRQ